MLTGKEENKAKDEGYRGTETREDKPKGTSQKNCDSYNGSSSRGDENSARITRKQRPRKALAELSGMVEDAILGNHLLGKASEAPTPSGDPEAPNEQLQEIALWGVPLSRSKGHPATDIVLMKFLKARDFRVHDAFDMLQRTLNWRRKVKIDSILDEDLQSNELQNLIYMDSTDRDGRPLCFQVFGALNDRKLYSKVVGTREACESFLRWRVQFLEKSAKELNLRVDGANSIVQITDLKHLPGPAMKEFRWLSRKVFMLVQEHYPELIHKEIIINAPLWYYVSHVLSMKSMNQRTKSKFIFVRSSNVTKILLKYIAPQNLPVTYGGLKRVEDDEFSPEDRVNEKKLRKNSTGHVRIPVAEVGKTMVWDLTVVGWDVSYKEEFIPDDEASYRILLQYLKEKKETQSIRNSYYISEPGKIVITIANKAFKKKKVIYRYKAKPTIPMYLLIKR